MILTLPLSPAESTHIAGPFSYATVDGSVVYFCNLDPFDRHPADDRRALNQRIARLHRVSGVRIVDLVDAFEVSRSTIKRAVKLLDAEGEEGFSAPRPTRGRVALTPESIRRAERMLASGTSAKACARDLGVAASTFYENLRAGVVKRPGAAPAPAPAENAGASDRSRRDSRDRKPALGRACHDSAGRRQAAAGAIREAEPRFEEPARAVVRGGVLAALPMLISEGLLAFAKRLPALPNGFYGMNAILLLLAFMAMARIRAPEELRRQAPGEWGVLLGLDRAPEAKTLRRKIALLAESERAVRDWQSALARSWVDASPGDWATLAVDGHVKVYSGRKGRLPKHFVSRQKLCLPASVSYWANALGGMPLLCVHKALDPKLVKAIEGDVMPLLEKLGVAPADGPDLIRDGGREPLLTLVFDREGWSPDMFRRLARRGVACITWRKNFKGEPWPEEDFKACGIPVHGPSSTGSATVLLAEKPARLPNGLEVREIRRLLGSGRQAAFVATHPTMPIEEAAGALFSRWSQENFFKYMREEFALDSIPCRGLDPLDPEAEIPNPARRAAEKAIARLRRRLRKADPAGEAVGIVEEILDVKAKREGMPARIRAGDLDGKDRLHALPAARRLLLDTIRMVCYRAETRMMRAMAGRVRNPRKLIQAAMAADANIVPDREGGVLRVQLPGLGSDSLDRDLEALLGELTRTRTIYPGTNLRLVYEIAAKSEEDASR